jgi:PPM family protein phosphatase
MTAPDDVRTAERSMTEKPRDDQIDVYGLTHRGRVRETNQDHFLICALRKRMDVYLTSLPDIERIPAITERLGFLAMVADGVGGEAGGEQASRSAVEAITQYVAHSMHCYYTTDASDDRVFADALLDVAMRTHSGILASAADDPSAPRMATTLTLWLGAWPNVWLLQVGDSRCYMLRGDELMQITRDQTLAEEMVERGVITRAEAPRTRWANVLSSALGGPRTTPVVTRIENDWNAVHMLCSDGLTKHVSDDRIRERLRTMTSCRQVCEALLDDALEGGGTDNITIIVGRTRPEP